MFSLLRFFDELFDVINGDPMNISMVKIVILGVGILNTMHACDLDCDYELGDVCASNGKTYSHRSVINYRF